MTSTPEAAIRIETPDGRPVYQYLLDRPGTVVLRTPTGVLRLRLGPSGWVLLDTPDGALRFQPEASNAAYVAVDRW